MPQLALSLPNLNKKKLLMEMVDVRDELNKRRKFAHIERAKNNILDFTTYTKSDYNVNWHHKLLCSYLDRFVAGDIRRLMVFMPPRHGKSELVSRRLPAYIFGKNPNAKIIAASYSADLARLMNRDTQRIIDSEEYCDVFPKTRLFGKNIRAMADGSYLRNSDIFEIVGCRGIYRCGGVGGGITGMGADYAIIDDPIKNQQEAMSTTYRNATHEWYTSTLYSRLEKDDHILITLTRWHDDDLAGRLLKLSKKDKGADRWEILSLPAIRESAGHPDDHRKIGEPLWPWKYNKERLDAIKINQGTYKWSALYQQSPMDTGGGIVKLDWFKQYHILPDRRWWVEVCQFWDTAQKANELLNCPWVCGTWVRTHDAYYLADVYREWMEYPQGKRMVKSLADKWEPNAIVIEDKSTGSSLLQEGDYFGTLPMVPFEPESDKITRLSVESPTIEAGNVFLPESAPWLPDFLAEIGTFPLSATMDQADMLSMALKYFRTRIVDFDFESTGNRRVTSQMSTF